MKAEDLIEQLKELPKDADVTFYHDYNHENMDITNIAYTKKEDGDNMSPLNSEDNQIVFS